MTTCALVLGVISCVVAPGSRLTPAEAAAILAPRQTVLRQTTADLGPGPRVTMVASASSREFPVEAPERRLDGSRWTDPQWTAVHWAPRRDGRYGGRASGPSRPGTPRPGTPGTPRTPR